MTFVLVIFFQSYHLTREHGPFEGITDAFENLMNSLVVLFTYKAYSHARAHLQPGIQLQSRNLGLNLTHQLLVWVSASFSDSRGRSEDKMG